MRLPTFMVMRRLDMVFGVFEAMLATLDAKFRLNQCGDIANGGS